MIYLLDKKAVLEQDRLIDYDKQNVKLCTLMKLLSWNEMFSTPLLFI